MATSPISTAAEEDDERPNHGYSELYENIALYPELGRFRRFTAEWAKLLHDDTVAVLTNQSNVNKALKKARKVPCGLTVLDCPRSFVEVYHPDIYEKEWKPYEKSLRQYGETLCLSQQIMTLPAQADFATRQLANFGAPIFDSGRFGLTQEPASWYLGPSERYDSCSWRGPQQDDFLTKRFLGVSPWIEDKLLKRIRNLPIMRTRTKQEDEPDLRHHVVLEIMDLLTCTFASLLLTGAMFALAYIRPLNSRIGAVGALGTVFSWSVKLMAGHPSRRIEVYAATAAFFAVASVFVSNTGNGCGTQ